MGYDFELTNHENRCEICGRGDNSMLSELYVSYNHSWAFYKYLDEDKGLRFIYDRRLENIIPKLKSMVDELIYINGGVPSEVDTLVILDIKGSKVANDGWATTVYNAYRCAKDILTASEEAVANGYVNATWSGD